MNETSYGAACKLVPSATPVQQGRDARRTHERHIRVLIEQVLVKKHTVTFTPPPMQRKLPDEGWSNLRIELLLQELALMDSNNFPGDAEPCIQCETCMPQNQQKMWGLVREKVGWSQSWSPADISGDLLSTICVIHDMCCSVLLY